MTIMNLMMYFRNLVHHGAIEMVTRAVSPVQLFNFLLSHEKQVSPEQPIRPGC